jgi:deoxyribose-phosphate aldolase
MFLSEYDVASADFLLNLLDTDPTQIARLTDHTLLKPDTTERMIRRLCREALQYGFASVCVNPTHVPLCAETLQGSEVKVCTVIGFPLGATTTEDKIRETKTAIEHGATEIDMVINIGALKDGEYEFVEDQIEAVVEAAHSGGALCKVIIETSYLSAEEIVRVCHAAKQAKADFVKTSTGFSTAGAKTGDVALMRQTVGPDMGVKASGGVRTYEASLAMIEAGATRLGLSAGVAIYEEAVAVTLNDKEQYIRQAIALSQQAVDHGNHPFGALLVKDGEVLLSAENTVHTEHDATHHAELNLVSAATRQFDLETLAESILYTSTEPCAMCAGAIMWGGIGTVVYGCSAEKLGELTGATFVVPARELYARALRRVTVIGPILEDEAVVVHKSYWGEHSPWQEQNNESGGY